jgi:hypothetical protein
MLLRKVFEAVANDILGAGNQFGGRSKLVAKFHPLQVGHSHFTVASFLTLNSGAFSSRFVMAFIPIYPNALNCVPKPPRAGRMWSILINGLGASRAAITRLENR